ALNRGRVSQAINDYRDVVTQDASASNRFHLAIAYARARNERAARFHFEAALEAGLSVESLYPLERPAYAELAAIVGVPADSDASSSGEDDRYAPVAPTS